MEPTTSERHTSDLSRCIYTDLAYLHARCAMRIHQLTAEMRKHAGNLGRDLERARITCDTDEDEDYEKLVTRADELLRLARGTMNQSVLPHYYELEKSSKTVDPFDLHQRISDSHYTTRKALIIEVMSKVAASANRGKHSCTVHLDKGPEMVNDVLEVIRDAYGITIRKCEVSESHDGHTRIDLSW